MGTRFQKARFHILTGPESLFERVRFKLRDCKVLQLHATHLKERAELRNIHLDSFARFDLNTWSLKTVEVRIDTGKFVNSAWEVVVNGHEWWVVIGLPNTIENVFPAEHKKGLGSMIITQGPLYDFASRINRELMDFEAGL